VHEIDGAVRQSDVVEDVVQFSLGDLAAYVALNEVAQLRGLFDSRAALGTQMQN
jgi:hypothetical protein